MMRSSGLRHVSAALTTLLLAAACSEQIPTKPAARSFTPSLSMSVGPSSSQHVFLLNGNSVPNDFAASVAAKGGSIVSSMTNIGVVVTRGLSDEDAASIAGKSAVARDYEGQWLTDSLSLSTATMDTPIDETSAKPPQTALFLPLQWNMFQVH